MADEDQIIFRLTADERPLLADLARVRKQLAAQKLQLRASLDRGEIDKQLASFKSASVKITADTTQARSTFADLLQSINRQRSTLHIGADTSAARATYEALVASVGKPITVKATAANARVSVDRSQYEAFIRQAGKPIVIPARVTVDRSALDSLKAKPISVSAKVVVDRSSLKINPRPITIPARVQFDRSQYDAFTRSVGRMPAIQMRADASQARAEVARLSRKIAALRQQAASIRVQINAAGAQGQLAALQRQLATVIQQTNALAQAAQAIRFPAIPGGGHAGGGLGFFGGGAIGGIAMQMLGGSAGATFGSSVGGAIGSFGGPGGVALGAASGAGVGVAGDATVGTITAGLGKLGELEKYEATIKSIVKDQTEANKLFADLRKLNESLPTVQMSTLADSATKLAGAGMDAEHIPEALTSIMDAAATSSDGVALGTKRVVRAISQMRTNQRLLSEELNQLTETGIPASQILVRQYGMSIEEIKKASQSGEIAINDIIDKLLKGFRDERGGGLAAQAETYLGKLAALEKQFEKFAMKVAEPLFEPLTKALGELGDAADAGMFDGIAKAMLEVTEASAGFLAFLSDVTDRIGPQAKETNLSVALTGGIREGKLSPEELRNANAAQLASNTLANRRKEDPKAILSQQDTATFFGTAKGEYVDPNAITDYQRQMVTNMLDQMAAAEANIPVPSVRQTERTQQYAGVIGTLVDNVGPNGKYADRELDRQRVREIAARGFDAETQERIRNGSIGGKENTAASEAVTTVDQLAADATVPTNASYVSEIKRQISDVAELLISGQIDATVSELEALAGRLDKAGQGDAASRVRDKIKERENAAAKAASDARAEATGRAAGFVNRGANRVGGFFGKMAGKLSEATGIDVMELPSRAMNASNELRAGDAQREKERLRSESDGRRFDKAAKDLPDAFKKFTADITDPEVKKLVEGSTLDLKQTANVKGGFDPTLALRELGSMTQKRGTQTTDMGGLNSLVQANIEDAAAREDQKKMLAAQEKIREFTEKQNELLQGIKDGVNKPKETVIGAN